MPEPMKPLIHSSDCSTWDADTILRVVRGRGWLKRRYRRKMVLHLLLGCEECAEKVREATRVSGTDKSQADPCNRSIPAELNALFERSLARLEQMERPAQELYLRGVDRLKSDEFVNWAIGLARTELNRDPNRSVRLARLAMLAAEDLSVETRALAAIYMGHVWGRAKSDFRGADTWFDQALKVLGDGDSDPRLRAKLLRMQGLSRYNQSRSNEAIGLFDEAAQIYTAVGDTNQLGQTFVDSAGAIGEEQGSKKAVARLFRACCLIDFERYPRYAMAIAGNLSQHYAELGDPDRALGFLEIARDLVEREGAAPADALRIDWSAGRIMSAAGRPSESLELFNRARGGFVGLGLAGEAGQISLDMALSLLELGRMRELRELAEEMLPIFQSRLLHKEALAAIEFFRESVRAETITAAQIHAVSSFLAELEANKQAQFRRPR